LATIIILLILGARLLSLDISRTQSYMLIQIQPGISDDQLKNQLIHRLYPVKAYRAKKAFELGESFG
jgi:hypothetical protein